MKKYCFNCKNQLFKDFIIKRTFNFCLTCCNQLLKTRDGKDLDGNGLIRQLVRIKDKNTCTRCQKVWNGKRKRFDVHHLDGKCGKTFISRDKISDIKKMITLCHKCHFNLEDVKVKMKKSTPKNVLNKWNSMRKMRAKGHILQEIATQFGLTRTRVWQVTKI